MTLSQLWKGVKRGFGTVFSFRGAKLIGREIKEGQERIRAGELGEPLKEFLNVAETAAGFTGLKYATRALEAYGDFATGDVIRGFADTVGLTFAVDEIRNLTKPTAPSQGTATIAPLVEGTVEQGVGNVVSPSNFMDVMEQLGFHSGEDDGGDRTDYFGVQ